MSKPNLAIRAVTPSESDLAAVIAEVTNRSYASQLEALFVASDINRIEVAEAAEAIADGEMVVAEVDGRIVGAVRVCDIGEKTSFFEAFAVVPEASGEGIGHALLDYIEAQAAGSGQEAMELEVLIPDLQDAHQNRLRAWYGRRGYAEITSEPWNPANAALVEALRSPSTNIRCRKPLRVPPPLSRGNGLASNEL